MWHDVTGFFSKMYADVTGTVSKLSSDVTGFFRRLWSDVVGEVVGGRRPGHRLGRAPVRRVRVDRGPRHRQHRQLVQGPAGADPVGGRRPRQPAVQRGREGRAGADQRHQVDDRRAWARRSAPWSSEVKNFLPFSPAKKGPLSGSGAPNLSGRSVARLFAQGITAGRGGRLRRDGEGDRGGDRRDGRRGRRRGGRRARTGSSRSSSPWPRTARC